MFFDIIFEVVAETVVYAYVSLIEYFMPKKLSDKAERWLRLIAVFVALFLFIGLVAGIILVSEGYGFGWIFIILATVYFVVGIILGIVKSIKK